MDITEKHRAQQEAKRLENRISVVPTVLQGLPICGKRHPFIFYFSP